MNSTPRLQFDKRWSCMHQQTSVAYDVTTRTFHPVDHQNPLDALIEAEEADDAENIDFAAIKGIPRDALMVLLRFLIPATAISPKKRWRRAQLRLAVLSHFLDVDGLGGRSFKELGEELGCTKALLSLYSLRLLDGLNIEKSRHGKSRVARESYRQSAIESHKRQGHTIKGDQ